MSPVLLLLTSSLSALDIAQLAGDWTPDPEASWQAQLRAKPGLATATGDALAAERERMLRRCARSTFTLAADRIVIRVRRDDGSERSDIAARSASLLSMLGLDQWKDMKVKRYSKGMMQRLGLAQALINDPDILFLDEPTDGVDPVGRKEIRDFLLRLRNEGKTIFLNSHMLSEVEMICDRVAILDKGKLVKVGSVGDLTITDRNYEIGVAEPPPERGRSIVGAKRGQSGGGFKFQQISPLPNPPPSRGRESAPQSSFRASSTSMIGMPSRIG